MSWRRGELWLENDVLWFREPAAVPAAGGFAFASIPSLGPPPGLIASRQRRAARNRRRNVRRARATALVLSPALLLPLAALRNGGGTKVVVEDPPELTFPRSAVTPKFVEEPVPRRLGTEARRQRSDARAEEFPKIEWHHATSVGLPYDGRLIDGTQLPIEGPNWVTWDPVTDSVPNAPNRLYGNEHTIRAILSVVDAYRAANPDAPRVVIGDISLEGGGPMTDEHVSHQNGLDVDIYYPRLDRTLRAPVSPDEIDRPLAQDLLDRFVAAGAQMIFVGYSTGLHGPSGIVIPYPNHDNHMHVRFPPPGG
jgi:Penicillin-insensitive murein endopeptidase